MNEQLMKVRERFKDVTGKMSPKVKKIAIAGIVIAIVFSVVAAIVLNNKPYDVLFSGLTTEEASQIMGKLQEDGIDYKFQNGDTILIPKNLVDLQLAKLTYEGYPKSGFTYDIFRNNVDLMSTDFEKKKYELYEMQDRLASTIRLFDNVKEAVVNLTPASEQRYVSDINNATKASASVLVTMKDGGSPTQQQANGIRTLVAKSVRGLDIEDVAVLDGNGIEVTPVEEDSQENINKLKNEYERNVEQSIRNKVMTVLGPIYGNDNVRIAVKATADLNKIMRESIIYNTPEGQEKGIPSREAAEQEISRGDENAVGGIPGTEVNADIPVYAANETNGTETYIRNSGEVDYLVSQLKEQTQIDAADLRDVTVAVTINGEDFGNLNRNELITLVAKAAGINQEIQNEKVQVVSAPFYNYVEPVNDTEQNILQVITSNRALMIALGIACAVLALLMIILILVGRARKKKRIEEEERLAQEEAEQQAAAAAAAAASAVSKASDVPNILDIQNDRSMELKNQIREFTDTNPEIAAQLLKSWLRGGESNNG